MWGGKKLEIFLEKRGICGGKINKMGTAVGGDDYLCVNRRQGAGSTNQTVPGHRSLLGGVAARGFWIYRLIGFFAVDSYNLVGIEQREKDDDRAHPDDRNQTY